MPQGATDPTIETLSIHLNAVVAAQSGTQPKYTSFTPILCWTVPRFHFSATHVTSSLATRYTDSDFFLLSTSSNEICDKLLKPFYKLAKPFIRSMQRFTSISFHCCHIFHAVKWKIQRASVLSPVSYPSKWSTLKFFPFLLLFIVLKWIAFNVHLLFNWNRHTKYTIEREGEGSREKSEKFQVLGKHLHFRW